MHTVLVARHGEVVSNGLKRYAGGSSESLTERGAHQAQALATLVAEQGIREVWTSEVARAVQTAQIVSARLGVPLRRDPRLNEMILGPWEGLTEEEVERQFPEAYRLWNHRPDQLALDGRETLMALARRVVPALEDAGRAEGAVLCVTHVAPVRVAALSVLGLPLSRYKGLQVPNGECFQFDLACRSVERMAGGSLAVELARPRAVPAA